MLPRSATSVEHDARASTRPLLLALNEFARPHALRSLVQVATTLGAIGLVMAASRWLAPSGWRALLVVPLAPLLVRLFCLQHDCGHHSLFRRLATNDRVGTLLSFVTGVAYDPWRTEHAWHHTHQAKLSHRGIDRVNSPMTADEALRERPLALERDRLISAPTVFLFGFVSLILKRKRRLGFFPFRPGFRWRIHDRDKLVRRLYFTNAAFLFFQVALLLLVGPRSWALVILPSYFLGGGIGGWLFWVQHNFERTYHADDSAWSYVDAGLRGASFLKLPSLLGWLTADIGLHHVHHLNPRVPNYRLEEARLAIPELARIAPLTLRDLGRCFTHLFWDPKRGRMVSLHELDGS